jgi:hypothetical protein
MEHRRIGELSNYNNVKTTSYEFLKSMSKKSRSERDAEVRKIGHNNFIRQILLTAVLKVVEPIFRMNFKSIFDQTKKMCNHLPSSVYTDRYWLDNFAFVLETIIRSDMKDINIEKIIADTFTNLDLIKKEMGDTTITTEPSDLKEPEKHDVATKIINTIKPSLLAATVKNKYMEPQGVQVDALGQKSIKINDKLYRLEDLIKIESIYKNHAPYYVLASDVWIIPDKSKPEEKKANNKYVAYDENKVLRMRHELNFDAKSKTFKKKNPLKKSTAKLPSVITKRR